MAGMLRDVNIRGTAADVWAGGFYHPSGGKTGTSNDYRDAWYIGFTKRYTVAVWVGTDDHASLGAGHTGTDDAMPIWLDVMRGLHKGMKVREFEKEFPRPAGRRRHAHLQAYGTDGAGDSAIRWPMTSRSRAWGRSCPPARRSCISAMRTTPMGTGKASAIGARRIQGRVVSGRDC